MQHHTAQPDFEKHESLLPRKLLGMYTTITPLLHSTLRYAPFHTLVQPSPTLSYHVQPALTVAHTWRIRPLSTRLPPPFAKYTKSMVCEEDALRPQKRQYTCSLVHG